MRRFGLLGVLLVGLLSVTLLQPAQAADCTTVEVLGTDEPKDSGITVAAGDSISVEATGLWGFNMDGPIHGPDGAALTDPDSTMPDENVMALIGMSGGGDWHLLGASGGFTADDSGTLYLMGNDEPGGFFDNSGSISVEVCVEEGGGGGWTRPLRAADEAAGFALYDNFNLLDTLTGPGGLPEISSYIAAPTQYRVYATSIEGGAPVMTAQAGTVTDIVYASADMCSIWGAFFQTCLFAGPDSAEVFELFQFPIDFSVQQVTITLDDGTELRYTVADADHYVKLGQHVNEGCVIGETIIASEPAPSRITTIISEIVANFTGMGGLLEPGTGADFGIAMVEHRDPGASFEMIQLLPALTEYNEEDEPCNINENFRDCLVSDPDLTHGAEAWTFFGETEATAAGVELRPDSYIEQVINVPEDTSFTFRVGAYYDILDLLGGGVATDHTLLIRVGSFSDTITVPPSDQYQEFTLEVPTPDPDPGGLGFTVRIANTSDTGGVIISGACLTTEDHELNPRMCYFANPDFDSLQGWLSTTTQTGAGFVNLGDLDYVSQDVTLEANEDDSPRTYHLLLDVRIIAAPGATLDTSTGTATMFYAWEGTNTVGTLDLTWNQPGEPGYPDGYQTLSTDIVVTEHSSDTFYISSGIDGNSTIHIALSRACLSTDDTPPGSGVGGPFQTTCSTISIPTDNEFGSWIQYHWRNLDKFFNCKLMILLNKWFRLFDDFRRTTLLVFRWGIAFINKAVDWSITLMWWLNGHFRNIAMGQVTTIVDGGGCHDIFCAIVDVTTTLGNLLTPIVAALNNVVNVLVGVFVGVVNLFFTLIGGLVAFVVALLIKLMSFIGIAISLLTGLVGAYNGSTPTAIPGLPSCAIDPSSSPFCYAVWVADNTIFSGRWNTLFNILLSVLAIHLILYTVREIKHIVLQTWSSS